MEKIPKVLWMKVTTDRLELPLMVCDTARELAERCGTSTNCVISMASRAHKGKVKKTPYRSVKIEEDA